MKILIATGLFPPDIGGPATYSKLLSDELPKSGIEVAVLSFGSVRHLPKVIRHIAYACMLIRRARGADAIFAQDTVSVGLPALFAARILGKKFAVRVPGDYAWEQASQRYGVTDTIDDFQDRKYGLRIEALRAIQKFVVRRAGKAIAPSRYFAELVSRWCGAPGRAVAIYNGIDVAAIQAATRGVSFAPKTILSAGRLVPWKGFAMLIRALKKLDGWTLEIAGDGPDMARLAQLIADEGMNGRATLLGRLDKSELMKKIASAEIFALNTAFESFSFQVVEAMAGGTPVITTRVGDLAEIIADGSEGILIAPDSEDEFVAAVGRLSSDNVLRSRIVAAAAKKAGFFSIGSTVRATKEALIMLS